MLGLILKWFTIALLMLALFSAVTALYMFYTLEFGACKNGGETCLGNTAVLYASGIGIVGFSTSAFASYIIAKRFRENGD